MHRIRCPADWFSDVKLAQASPSRGSVDMHSSGFKKKRPQLVQALGPIGGKDRAHLLP
jgi:hypothetical protein